MLKRRPSLAFRAALIFMSIYAAVFFAILALVASGLVDDSEGQSGPTMALAFAAEEPLAPNGLFRPREDGAFIRLARKNPGLWLLGDAEGRRFSFGPVPQTARRLFDQYVAVRGTGAFMVPGVAPPLAAASVERRLFSGRQAIVAAGGVNPATLTAADFLRYFLTEGVFAVLLWLGLLGLLAMAVALPLITGALRPIAGEVSAIGPDTPERRISEARAPREVVPLVRGFNSALDRLASELARRRRLLADLAHELRTPLTIALLRVESLRDEEAKLELQRVLSRLSHLTGQLLDVERLALGNQQCREIDLAELARNIVADMAPMAIAGGYELSIVAPPEAVTVAGDPQAIGRAIANLIGNAVAHAGGRGQIQVIIGETGTLDVVDEGPGVAPTVRSTLFEPFSRERWDRDGCGLGLHLVREIMRAHQGEALLLESERGAAFRLQFPFRQPEKADAERWS